VPTSSPLPARRAGAPLPLEGFRVVDLTANMAGPFCTQVLGDQGADVVKVEPISGDVIRGVGTSRGGISTYFANLNRNKRSLAVDIGTDAGREIVLRLVDGADVFVENYRAGAITAMGLGPEVLRERDPRLVYASITGFGHCGPYGDLPAYDHVIQALSGVAARQASRNGGPDLIRQGGIDKVSGLWLAQSVTAALLRRTRTGEGATVEVCMLEAAIAWLWPDGMMNHTLLGEDARVLQDVAASFRLTPTLDGHIAIAILTGEQWRGVATVAGREDLLDDPEFATVRGRTKLGGPVLREFGVRAAATATDALVASLQSLGVPCAPVVAMEDVATHPQMVAGDVVREVDHPVMGRMRMPRAVPTWSDVEPVSPLLPPSVGQHTDDVLAGIGFDATQIEKLRADGIVA
jgi:crotonobetainyl-CoA:carnitine CoA-transferase CaiB-like acyl-CoA transferase